jgi:FAD/FMN-containing dehydrogenase
MIATDRALLRLVDRIRDAVARHAALDIRGGGTKGFYGEVPRGEPFDTAELAGISSYDPSELVITARAGTRLTDLDAEIAACGQCLPFEPPRFGAAGTVGGMVAAGLAGPARASVGSLRDFVLGVTLLDGRADVLTFGGQVMKNVAGYDVSRVMAGSWGVLGVICEVSLKVLPVARATATLAFECDERQALARLNAWAAQALPLNASSWHDGRLIVRLAGAEAAVGAARHKLGGAPLVPEQADAWWAGLRDHRHDFFVIGAGELASDECLWRVSVPAVVAPLELPGSQFIEWGGAQRWWRTQAPAAELRGAAARAGGHATLVRAADKGAGAFTRPAEPLMRIHRSLKLAFDPAGIFNPGRLYADL